jgi:multidrug efflux pump subunit AcrB
VAVFVPIAFMGGIVGKFFYPFGITVAVAVLVSLFVSFTLDPMLSRMARPPRGMHQARFVGPVLRALIVLWIVSMQSMESCLAGCCRRASGRIGTKVPKTKLSIGVPTIGIGARYAPWMPAI